MHISKIFSEQTIDHIFQYFEKEISFTTLNKTNSEVLLEGN